MSFVNGIYMLTRYTLLIFDTDEFYELESYAYQASEICENQVDWYVFIYISMSHTNIYTSMCSALINKDN